MNWEDIFAQLQTKKLNGSYINSSIDYANLITNLEYLKTIFSNDYLKKTIKTSYPYVWFLELLHQDIGRNTIATKCIQKLVKILNEVSIYDDFEKLKQNLCSSTNNGYLIQVYVTYFLKQFININPVEKIQDGIDTDVIAYIETEYVNFHIKDCSQSEKSKATFNDIVIKIGELIQKKTF